MTVPFSFSFDATPVESVNFRTSSYVIYVDLPGDHESVLLVHGYTGAYDLVKRTVAAFLRSCEAGPVPRPLYGDWSQDEIDSSNVTRPADQTVEILRKRGYLTTKSVAEEQDLFTAAVAALHSGNRSAPLNYVIMPTYDCNLRCAYCFQDHMRTDSRYSHLLRTMSNDMVDKVIAAIPQLEKLNGVSAPETRSFTLFGGEPLLRQSLPVVERIVSKAKEIGGASFFAITNATELQYYKDILGPSGISGLQITIDGPPEKHDTIRIHADGTGSFEEIASNLQMALDQDATVSVRMNIDRNNIQDIPRLAQYFIDTGWTSSPKFSAYVAPITDGSLDKPSRRHELFNTWELGDAISELKKQHPSMEAIAPVDDRMRTRALQLLTSRGADIPSQAAFCGAHTGMYLFDGLGDIYACWERTGDKNIRVGFLDDDGQVVLNAIDESWRSRTVASNPTCRQCRFALHCGGGCAVLAEAASGTMFSNYCDAFGKRFRAKVAEAYEQFAAGDGVDEKAIASAKLQEFVR